MSSPLKAVSATYAGAQCVVFLYSPVLISRVRILKFFVYFWFIHQSTSNHTSTTIGVLFGPYQSLHQQHSPLWALSLFPHSSVCLIVALSGPLWSPIQSLRPCLGPNSFAFPIVTLYRPHKSPTPSFHPFWAPPVSHYLVPSNPLAQQLLLSGSLPHNGFHSSNVVFQLSWPPFLSSPPHYNTFTLCPPLGEVPEAKPELVVQSVQTRIFRYLRQEHLSHLQGSLK